MRVGLVALALLATVFAGCSEEAAPMDTDEETFDGVEVKATAETGVIRGVVVDTAVVPIAGVTVTLLSTGKQTITNDNGAFGFQGLDPGSYFLTANKTGFQEIQTSSTVTAGVDDPPILRIQMVRDPTTQPFVVPATYDAYIQCAESLILVGYAGGCSNDFLTEYGLSDIGRTPDWAQSELVWESTQPLGDWMAFMYSVPRAGQTLLHNYVEVEGPSPLLIFANRTTMEEQGVVTADGGCSGTLCIRIFNSGIEGTDIGRDFGDPRDGDDCIERPQLGGCMVGFGATIDQVLTVYTHMFFNFQPPEGWRFTVDGNPPMPDG